MKTMRLVCLVLLSSLFVNAISCSRAAAQKKEIEKIRTAGDPVSIADLKPTDVAPQDNAETYLVRVADEGQLLYNQIGSHIHSDDFNWKNGLSQEQIEKAEEGFKEYPKVWSSLEQASECKSYVSSLDYGVKAEKFNEQILVPIQARRNVARLFDCRAKYLASVGKPDEAALVYLQLLRLSQLQQNEPLLISFLVDLAMRGVATEGLNGILQTNELKQETYAAIEEALARQDSMDNFVQVLKGERAFGIETFQGLSNPLGIKNGDFRRYLAHMGRQIEVGAKSHFEVEEIEAPRGGLAAGIIPAMQASREAMNRTRAMMRCVRILNAIHFRTMQADDVKFADLRLPEEIGIDPYCGKPLTIKKTEDGWTVYALGMNGLDDGPILDSITDVGIEPPKVLE